MRYQAYQWRRRQDRCGVQDDKAALSPATTTIQTLLQLIQFSHSAHASNCLQNPLLKIFGVGDRCKMLDPLTALGVAGTIVQFVDFTVKLMSKSHELYKSTDGALVGNKDLEAIAANLNRLTERLRTDMNRHLLPPVKAIKLRDDVSSKQAERELAFTLRDYTPENRAEIELGEINAKCGEVAGDLISILRMFKVEGNNNKWKSFRVALKTVWDEDQIQKAVSKLTECRKALDTELLISLR
jgi:hypothetical protein